MKRIDTHQTGIEQGTVMLFSDYEDGGEMWTGTGPREVRRVVEFDEPFARAPVVQVAVAMLDMDSASNHRIDISADMVTEDSFTVVFKTWGDTRVARARADWIAIGPIRHVDDWDLGS